jgi:hypothetical protein
MSKVYVGKKSSFLAKFLEMGKKSLFTHIRPSRLDLGLQQSQNLKR